MATQTQTGKAFEYALLLELHNQLSTQTGVLIVESEPYQTAKRYFYDFDVNEQHAYRLASSEAIKFLMDVEPRLYRAVNPQDLLELEIVSDSQGQKGDVRDVIMLRSKQNWQIGISAKNNHRAVKHPRLSNKIDFGDKWLGLPCSTVYFAEIDPIFAQLHAIRAKHGAIKWTEAFGDVSDAVYKPVLDAFRDELWRLNKAHPQVLSKKLLGYLIGEQDFYKVIREKTRVEIQAYNLHGSLNQRIGAIKPKSKIPALKLPNRLIEIVYKDDSQTTLIVSMDEGWQISFRLHTAKSTVEPSLKFDINLLSTPHSLFTTHIFTQP